MSDPFLQLAGAPDPLRVLPTERLVAELKRRSIVYCICMVEETEVQPGLHSRIPMLSWGSRSGMAHEALGLIGQALEGSRIEALSQMTMGGKSIPQHFNDMAEMRRKQAQSPSLTYQYIPPGNPPGTSP